MENKRVRAKVHMLPTEDKSEIVLHKSGSLGYLPSLSSNIDWKFVEKDWVNQHLYFTTDEKFAKGDYVIVVSGVGYQLKSIHKIDSVLKFNSDHCKKIVATTDESLLLHVGENYEGVITRKKGKNYKNLTQPSQAFMEKYVELGGIDEVDIELKSSDLDYFFGDLKVDSHNTITIHSIKNNWSREEVEKLLELAWATASAYGDKTDSKDCKDWMRHNL